MSATAGCSWSQNGPNDSQGVYAARESTVSLSLDSNQVICDVQLPFDTDYQPAGLVGPFGFDDHLLIAHEVIAASHNELVSVLSQDSIKYVYDWNLIKGTGMSFSTNWFVDSSRISVFTTYGLPCCNYKLGIESQFS